MAERFIEQDVEGKSKVYRGDEYFLDLVGRDKAQAKRLRTKAKPRKASYLQLLWLPTALAMLGFSVLFLGVSWKIGLIGGVGLVAAAIFISHTRASFKVQGKCQPPDGKRRTECAHFQGEADRCSYLSGARCVRR